MLGDPRRHRRLFHRPGLAQRTIRGLTNGLFQLGPRHAAGAAIMGASVLVVALLGPSDPQRPPAPPEPQAAALQPEPSPEPAPPSDPPAAPVPAPLVAPLVAPSSKPAPAPRSLGGITPITAMLRLAHIKDPNPPALLPLPIALAPAPAFDPTTDPGAEPETARADREPPRPAADAPSKARRLVDRMLEVRPGDTLMSLLTSVGVARQQAYAAIQALGDLFRPRDLKPGQALHLALAPEAGPRAAQPQLVSISFQPDPERDIRVTRDGNGPGYIAEAIARPLTREIVRDVAVIESSLYLAGRNAGIPNRVLFEAIRAFSFDVDFQRQVRRTDELELVYESHVDEAGLPVKSGALLYAALTLSGKRTALYRFTPKSGFTDYFDAEGHSVRRTLLRTPIDGARLSSRFGMRRHPILGYNKMHRGIDFAAPKGTPIYAAGNGVVERIGRNGGYGKYVRLRHNGTYKTAYAHLSRYAKGLKKGSKVKQGQVIGYVGSTGRSTGPHLHYEVLAKGRQVNPLKLDLPSGERLKGAELEAFQAFRAEIDALRSREPSETLMADAACGQPLAQGDSEPEAPTEAC